MAGTFRKYIHKRRKGSKQRYFSPFLLYSLLQLLGITYIIIFLIPRWIRQLLQLTSDHNGLGMLATIEMIVVGNHLRYNDESVCKVYEVGRKRPDDDDSDLDDAQSDEDEEWDSWDENEEDDDFDDEEEEEDEEDDDDVDDTMSEDDGSGLENSESDIESNYSQAIDGNAINGGLEIEYRSSDDESDSDFEGGDDESNEDDGDSDFSESATDSVDDDEESASSASVV
jgi:hypothetical protein